MNPKISIVIPTYSNSKGLHECLTSIVEKTDLDNLSIIVVANGAPDNSRDVHVQYPNTQLIWLSEACGYTSATNIGIKTAMAEGAEYIVLMNDDFLCTDHHPKNLWRDMLLAPFLTDGTVGITGPVRNFCHAAQRSFLIFFCVMIRTAILEEIGILDEVFSPGSGEDTDLCARAEDHGWKIQQVPSEEPTKLVDKGCEELPHWKREKMHTSSFPGYHDGNATFSLIPEVYEPAMQKNHAILTERYGAKALNTIRAKTVEGWFAEDEIDWLAAQVKALPEGAVVVEVGSWKGRSSRAIADNLPAGARLYCVDTWCGSSGEPDAHATAKDREGDDVYMSFFHALHDHIDAGRVVAVRMTSEHAAETMNNLQPSLIFLDGDHSETGITTDINAWLPLLKPGGLLCGHDYYKEGEGLHWVHVRQTVEARFPNVQKAATSIWHVRPHEEMVERGRVFDCFLFANELSILEIRLATLYDHVDYFVLVEARRTHAGLPKELHFDNNKQRFASYLNKIRHVIMDELPDIDGTIYDKAWARERAQRDACMIALEDCQPNDVIIIGDADEIASPEAIDNYQLSDGLVRLKQRMFYYYLNCENKEGWDWQKVVPYSLVKQLTPCGIRYPPAGEAPLVEGGGWHFSFAGNAEHVRTKLRDYSHQEMNRPEILAGVDDAIANGTDLFGRDLKYEFVPIDATYPKCVYGQQPRWLAAGLVKPTSQPDETTIESYQEYSNLLLEHMAQGAANALDLRRPPTVTACVSTKDRYTTTLPICLSAIINQTRKPEKLKVYDDGEQANLFELAPFDGLLRLAQDKGIDVEVLSTPRKGQVSNHQHCLDAVTTTTIWRVDDDEIPEPNCLEKLLEEMREGVGAVAGLVHHPANVSPLPPDLSGSLADINRGNIQWHDWNSGPKEVEHLYSTFAYSVDAAREAGGYPMGLSPAGHREESIFSHKLHRAGYKLLVTPYAKTAHLRQSAGGIRSYSDTALWEHDEGVFQSYLRAWNLPVTDTKLIVCDFGLGDHLILKGIWPELQRKFPDRKWTMALCYPEVFKDEVGITIISIADAKLLLGSRYDEHSVYRYAWDNNFERPMPEVMLEFFGK